MAEVPIGTVVAFAGVLPTDDRGQVIEVVADWLLCNGAPVSSRTFGHLHTAIQASHGNGSEDADAATDFNLPDFRGLFLRGVNGPRTDAFTDPNHADNDRPRNHPGGNVGNRVGSVQADEVRSHNHGINDPGHTHPLDAFRTDGAGAVGQAFPRDSNGFGTGNARTNITIQNSGGSESRPKNAYVHYIIRAR